MFLLTKVMVLSRWAAGRVDCICFNCLFESVVTLEVELSLFLRTRTSASTWRWVWGFLVHSCIAYMSLWVRSLPPLFYTYDSAHIFKKGKKYSSISCNLQNFQRWLFIRRFFTRESVLVPASRALPLTNDMSTPRSNKSCCLKRSGNFLYSTFRT